MEEVKKKKKKSDNSNNNNNCYYILITEILNSCNRCATHYKGIDVARNGSALTYVRVLYREWLCYRLWVKCSCVG